MLGLRPDECPPVAYVNVNGVTLDCELKFVVGALHAVAEVCASFIAIYYLVFGTEQRLELALLIRLLKSAYSSHLRRWCDLGSSISDDLT